MDAYAIDTEEMDFIYDTMTDIFDKDNDGKISWEEIEDIDIFAQN